MLSNKLIDPSVQKAFLPGVSGCTEHTCVLSNVLKQAKAKKRACHVAFFDLADAFGSVPHDVIMHTFERNYLPQHFIKYFKLHYSNLQSSVHTKNFKTNTFKFARGVTH